MIKRKSETIRPTAETDSRESERNETRRRSKLEMWNRDTIRQYRKAVPMAIYTAQSTAAMLSAKLARSQARCSVVILHDDSSLLLFSLPVVRNFYNGVQRLLYAVIDNRVDAHSNGVLGEHFLRRHVERYRPQIYPHAVIDTRYDNEGSCEGIMYII